MESNNFSDDAIVLKVSNTGESDRIVTFLTRERGIVKAFAKSANRPKNKLHSGTNLFCYGNYTFYCGTSSQRVTECTLNETFFGLRNSIEQLTLAQYFCELTCELAPTQTQAEDYIRLVLNSLFFLAEGNRDISILKAVFELRIASISGYMPDLVACKNCGNFETPVMYFDADMGSLYCENCRVQKAQRLSLTTVSAMRHICYAELNRLFSLKTDIDTKKALNGICEKYILINLNKRFKSLDFYNSL